MAAVPTSYQFIKAVNNNVVIIGLDGITPVVQYSLQPGKDLKIDERNPDNVLIPVEESKGAQNKFLSISYKKMDFANSTPSATNPADITEALDFLSSDFFFELGGGSFGCNDLIGCNISLLNNDAGYVNAAQAAAAAPVQSIAGNMVDNTDPVNPVVNAAVSSDAGNTSVLGTDNLIFTPATDISSKLSFQTGATYTGSTSIVLTLAEYNAIAVKDANTIYFIV